LTIHGIPKLCTSTRFFIRYVKMDKTNKTVVQGLQVESATEYGSIYTSIQDSDETEAIEKDCLSDEGSTDFRLRLDASPPEKC